MSEHCHDLVISVLETGGSRELELEPGAEALDTIRSSIAAGKLAALGTVWAEDRAIDIAWENGYASIVVVEIATGITYTYLNPLYASRFEQMPGHDNIYACDDMDEFAENEANSDALAEVEIGGADCPVLHVCDDPGTLLDIVTCFLETGELSPRVSWLKS